MSQRKKEGIVIDEEKDEIVDQNEKVDTQNQNEADNVKKQEVTVSTVNRDEDEDTTIYKVVVNHEEQYSIWLADRENPKGWQDAGKSGLKKECLAYIKEVWTDMRPLSLRKKMEEMEKRRPELEAEHARRIEEAKKTPKDPRDNLVKFLSEGNHPVEAGLRPEKTVKIFKEAIDRGYVHVKFTNTRGGTELGIRLDTEASDFSSANFEKETGTVHVEGNLILNYVKVRCLADIDLETLTGQGYLEIIEE
jgi:uncharacterized protein YbdZ (MbtH family)